MSAVVRGLIARAFFFLVVGLGLPLAALAADDEADIGMIKTVQGKVEIQRGDAVIEARPGLALRQGDVVRTRDNSSVGLTLRDNTVLSAGPRSELHLNKFTFDVKTQKGTVDATLKRGSLSGISGAIPKHSPEGVKFSTSAVTMGVRGTTFILEAADRE